MFQNSLFFVFASAFLTLTADSLACFRATLYALSAAVFATAGGFFDGLLLFGGLLLLDGLLPLDEDRPLACAPLATFAFSSAANRLLSDSASRFSSLLGSGVPAKAPASREIRVTIALKT